MEAFTSHLSGNVNSTNHNIVLPSSPPLIAPLQVPKAAMDRFSFIEDPRRQAYAAKAWWVDNAVGEIVDALKARGMWNNTAFFLTADNVSRGEKQTQ